MRHEGALRARIALSSTFDQLCCVCMGTEGSWKTAPTDKVKAVPRLTRPLAECYQESITSQLQKFLKGSIQTRSAFTGAERGCQDSSR